MLVAKLSIKFAFEKNREFITESQLSKKIVSIYKDAFGKPSLLIIFLLKFNLLLGTTKYISGYESWSSLLYKVKIRIFNFFS
jgi:hypothetical protein